MKDKALFPSDIVGFRRYQEDKLNDLIEKTGKKFASRYTSTAQTEETERIEAKEVKRPKSD